METPHPNQKTKNPEELKAGRLNDLTKRTNERTPNEVIAIIKQRLDRVVECLLGISSLADHYRRNIIPSGQNFLLGTVYDALWETVFMQLGATWDSNPNTASMISLSQPVKPIGRAAIIRDEIQKRC